MQENRDGTRKYLSEEKDWMIKFASRSDMTYANPGRQESVYIGKVDSERKYLPASTYCGP